MRLMASLLMVILAVFDIGMSVLFGTSTGRASHPKEEETFHLRNKPPSHRKPAYYGQEFRHRKHLCTRKLGIL